MGDELSKTPAGDLVIPAARLGKLKDADPARLRLTGLLDDLVLSVSPQPGERSRPVLYGDLRLFHVGELVALINSLQKDGTLHLLIPHARKTIFFSAGEIIYARSNVEDDRLGEVLWRKGSITLEKLGEVHDLVTPKKKLGAVLMERGLLTPRQLYEGIKEQILEIVYSTFHFHKGEFIFIEGKVRLKGTVRLDMNTREVMMEGIRRVEEMTRLEEIFPERETVLVKKVSDANLQDRERCLQDLIDGRRSVREIIENSHLGEFDALQALAKLQRLGLIEVSARPCRTKPEGMTQPEATDAYIRPLRYIHQSLKVEAPGEEQRLEAYLGSPSPRHQDVFRNVGIDADGRLDLETLFRNARKIDPRNPRLVAAEALRGLYDYAVFQAMDVLDDDACDRMMDKLQAIRDGQKD